MRAVVQRVSTAEVRVADEVVGAIGCGLLVLLGVEAGDSPEDIRWLASKVVELRIFEEAEGFVSASVRDTNGEVLVVSQFTLLASTRKGTRPSWHRAAGPEVARGLYDAFCAEIERHLGRSVSTGRFGAEMKVSSVNQGPVTLIVDSRIRE